MEVIDTVDSTTINKKLTKSMSFAKNDVIGRRFNVEESLGNAINWTDFLLM